MENKKKKNVGVVISYIILIFIILGLVGYILVDKDIINLKMFDKEEQVEKVEEEKVKKLSDEELAIILSKYGYEDVARSSGITDETLFRFFENGFDIASVSAGEYSALITNYIKMENNDKLKSSLNENAESDGNYIISVEEFNEAAKKVFGSDFVPNDLNGNYTDKCGRYVYNKEKNYYVATTHCGGVGPFYVYYNKIASYEIKNDVLTIKLSTIYSYTDGGDNHDYTLHRNLYGTSLLEEDFDDGDFNLYLEEEKNAKRDYVFKEYADKAINYEITLKVEEDNYYLQSVRKI